ncbi:MAG: T9SS type A sorting domain-containing protein [Flavobacteriales bacterium]|nr:T9SS type A sorting domain-containing protein [Flavobacteriales bacterium]
MIPSDAQHNWTGNYTVESPTELRLYGSSMGGIWFNSSPNGGTWNGYVSTNVQGGDPTVVKVGASSYLMVHAGAPNANLVAEPMTSPTLRVLPTPASGSMTVHSSISSEGRLLVFDASGHVVLDEAFQQTATLDARIWSAGCYTARVVLPEGVCQARFIIERSH